MIYIIIALLLTLGVSVYFNVKLWKGIKQYRAAMRFNSKVIKYGAIAYLAVLVLGIATNKIRITDE